jgi:hypothetical protein
MHAKYISVSIPFSQRIVALQTDRCPFIAFAILFGNENKESWGKCWNFVGHHYPSLNNPSITVITDQDKG